MGSQYKLGQFINYQGMKMFRNELFKRNKQFNPLKSHMRVRDISQIHWDAFRDSLIKYVVFDKDNTLTAPYNYTYYTP